MATMPLTLGITFVDPFEKLRALFSLSATTENALPHSSASALHNLFDSIANTVRHTIESEHVDQFTKRRDEALPRYANLIHAISLIVQAEIDEENFSSLAADSLNHLRDEFQSRDIKHFGSEASEQTSFCIFTLKRIYRTLPKLMRLPLAPDLRDHDRGLSIQFVGYMLFCHFHVECLRIILRQRLDVNPSVLTSILDGMGAGSSAYATLRQGLELRKSPELPFGDSTGWDDEDQALLDDSERSGITPA
jgi:hypothetical protein